jgi:predicted RNase H-like HicB family nuclease
MAIIRKHVRTTLDVLMSQEEGKFYAHCLAFDLLSEGKTEQQAKKNLAEMIFEHIRFFVEKSMEPFIFHPAPMKYWNILKMVKKETHFSSNFPEELLRATSPNRIAQYMNSVDAPAYA